MVTSGIYIHDPDCEACVRARLTAKLAYRSKDGDVIRGANKGYVMGVDYIGPYAPDVDGNVWGFIGVEVAHTNYGFVDLSVDKESSTAVKSVIIMYLKLNVKVYGMYRGMKLYG